MGDQKKTINDCSTDKRQAVETIRFMQDAENIMLSVIRIQKELLGLQDQLVGMLAKKRCGGPIAKE